jgi:hypothetical protein
MRLKQISPFMGFPRAVTRRIEFKYLDQQKLWQKLDEPAKKPESTLSNLFANTLYLIYVKFGLRRRHILCRRVARRLSSGIGREGPRHDSLSFDVGGSRTDCRAGFAVCCSSSTGSQGRRTDMQARAIDRLDHWIAAANVVRIPA